MNHTVTSFNASTINDLTADSQTQNQESLLAKIVSRLNTIAKFFGVDSRATQAHRSFIDANLLDPQIGPEISRTLRR